MPSTVQQTVSAAMTSGPYRTGRGPRMVTTVGASAACAGRNALEITAIA